MIDALGQVTNETERTALAQELPGKNAQELNPLILAGSGALSEYADEAERVGYILSEDQVKALGEADDAYQRLQLTIEGATATAGCRAGSGCNENNDALRRYGGKGRKGADRLRHYRRRRRGINQPVYDDGTDLGSV